MTTTTNAIRIHETGGPEVLRHEEVKLEAPGPGEALVRHRAVGLNFIDTYHRTGLYPVPDLPSGLGIEAAGVVEAVGEGVTEVSVGERVAYAAGPPGAYAGARLMAADRLVPLPDAIEDEVAAAMMLKGMTVEYLIRRTFEVRPGQTVLFHAAAGGVGLIACQWLRALGAKVIGTVGSDEKAELARAHGCHHPVVYTREDFTKRVRELTDGEGVPVVYDSVGRATFDGSLECLRPRGLMVSFGNASGKPDPFDTLALSQKGSLYLTRPSLFAYVATREELLASARALFEVVLSGKVTIEVRQRFPLEQAAEAHRALEARRTAGASILVP
jgi:NADPH2:quinone reductase